MFIILVALKRAEAESLVKFLIYIRAYKPSIPIAMNQPEKPQLCDLVKCWIGEVEVQMIVANAFIKVKHS